MELEKLTVILSQAGFSQEAEVAYMIMGNKVYFCLLTKVESFIDNLQGQIVDQLCRENGLCWDQFWFYEMLVNCVYPHVDKGKPILSRLGFSSRSVEPLIQSWLKVDLLRLPVGVLAPFMQLAS